MGMQLVLYQSNNHLSTQYFHYLERALVEVYNSKEFLDGFSIFPDDEDPQLIGFVGKNGTVHIYEPDKYAIIRKRKIIS